MTCAKRFARSTKMKKLWLPYGTAIAYKSYYVMRKKCQRYMDAFLSKCQSNLLHIEPYPSIIGH